MVARLTAVAVVATLVAIAVSSLAPSSGPKGGPPRSAPSSASAPASQDPASLNIVGLPPDGASLSPPTDADLVFQLDGNRSGPFSQMWLYADGRLIWSRLLHVPGQLDAFVGLAEQRLAPGGVDYLRSQIVDTGMFSKDLTLSGAAGFLQIRYREGSRLVQVTWAGSDDVAHPLGPAASAHQAAVLTALSDLLTNPTSWPDTVWDDATIRAYLPARYAICARRFGPGGDGGDVAPELIWARLPQAAVDLVQTGELSADGFCSSLPTAEARDLARILVEGGIQRQGREQQFWVRYFLPVPGEPDKEDWYSFEPILPDGEATWLGPG